MTNSGLLLSGFSSWCWFLIMLSLLFKQILLWLNPVSTWTACRHQGHQDISWHSTRRCLSLARRCAELQQDTQFFDLFLVPLRQLRTSAWALNSLDVTLHALLSLLLKFHRAGLMALVQWLGIIFTHAMEEFKGSRSRCLAWLRALHQLHLESNAGWGATPRKWQT